MFQDIDYILYATPAFNGQSFVKDVFSYLLIYAVVKVQSVFPLESLGELKGYVYCLKRFRLSRDFLSFFQFIF